MAAHVLSGRLEKSDTEVTRVAADGTVHRHRAPIGSTYLLAGRTLWIGADAGEWGGFVASVDVVSGVTSDPRMSNGVYGFSKVPDGRVFAHGGMVHMGFVSVFIHQLQPQRELSPRVLGLPKGHRMTPVVGIIPGDRKTPWYVITHEQLFRADKSLDPLVHAGMFRLRNYGGRPDAVGSYPAIRQHTSIGSGRVLLATRRDGLAMLDLAKGTALRSMPTHQLSHDVGPVLQSNHGLVVDGSETLCAWDEVAWRDIDPYPRRSGDERPWLSHRALVRPDGSLMVFLQDNSTPGQRHLVEMDDAGAVKPWLSLGDASLDPDTAFVHPSGAVMAVTADFDTNKQYVVELTKQGLRRLASGPLEPSIFSASQIWSDTTRTIILSGLRDLFELRRAGKTWTFTPLLRGPRVTDHLHDGERLILATEQGVMAYAPQRRTMAKITWPRPGLVPSKMERDRTGRLWLASADGLHVRSGEQEVLLEVPGVLGSKAEITNLKALSDGRMAVSMGHRGLLLLRLGTAP